LCICTALARLVPFQRLSSGCFASKSRGLASSQVHILRWQADSFQRLAIRCLASNVCIMHCAGKISFFSAASGCCIASRSRCTAIIQASEYMLCAGNVSSVQRLPGRRIASNWNTCTARARSAPFSSSLGDALQTLSTCTALARHRLSSSYLLTCRHLQRQSHCKQSEHMHCASKVSSISFSKPRRD
jgi:hypothetical protein